MGLFSVFKKKPSPPPAPAPKSEPMWDNMAIYSNMRVEVTTFEGHLLFVAKLMYPRGSSAELHQYSAADFSQDPEAEPLRVRIRGYHDNERKAVYMEGDITPKPRNIWQVENLSLARVGNDRAFFRLETDLPASVTKFSGRSAGDYPCRLRNISVGGARIFSDQQYWEGDKLLLTVKLMEARDPSVMFCQVLRVINLGDGGYEYGCRFLELNEADQDKITENIFTAQRKSRQISK